MGVKVWPLMNTLVFTSGTSWVLRGFSGWSHIRGPVSQCTFAFLRLGLGAFTHGHILKLLVVHSYWLSSFSFLTGSIHVQDNAHSPKSGNQSFDVFFALPFSREKALIGFSHVEHCFILAAMFSLAGVPLLLIVSTVWWLTVQTSTVLTFRKHFVSFFCLQCVCLFQFDCNY